MDHYYHYTVEELFLDEDFRNWVLRPTREDHHKWESWLADNTEKLEIVRQAREMVLHIHPKEMALPLSEKKIAISKILEGRREVPPSGFGRKPLLFPAYLRWVAAACIVLLASWYFLLPPDGHRVDYEGLVSEAPVPLVERVNKSNFPLEVVLEDGSHITLSPKSKISFPNKFNADKREVYLSGEAFFDISKDTSRPFFVYAHEVVTKVLGTSFLIRSFGNEQEVSVRVKSGRVAVFARQDTQTPRDQSKELTGTIIDPNQQIVVVRASVKMTKTLIPIPEIIVEPRHVNAFNFDDVPVQKVFETLEKAYSVEILVDSSVRFECPLSANLADLSLYEKLDLICKAVGARYEIIDGRIIIEGKGCK
ncbi:FecR family protein [Dyadobacter tibetensis]|uniref:FecR family protein n=1 Tax=Dyadobacter tibetensis TaxID=1211851 RepID=UPI00046F2468|nr:FecR family protein [Dyadobacter tibetensis]